MIARPDRLHVLMTADAVGGVWTYALELARATAEHGVRFTIAGMGPAPDEARWEEARAIPNVAVVWNEKKLEWMEDPWEEVGAGAEWLRGLERVIEPDVIHLNGYAHGAAGFAAPVLIVAHSCVLSWWRAVRGEEAPSRWDEYRERVREGIAGARVVVAPTRAMIETIERHYGPLPPEVATRVIWNGRERGLEFAAAKEPSIASMGRVWDEAKNIGAVVRVADSLPWPVTIAGEGKGEGERRARNAVALGRVSPSRAWRLLERASIFAHPARYEPFGLAPLEAAIAGCALVLGDIPTLREVWGDAAAFVDPEDGEALRASLTRLCEREDERRALAARSRSRAGRYSLRRLGREYAGLYEQLVAACAIGGDASMAER